MGQILHAAALSFAMATCFSLLDGGLGAASAAAVAHRPAAGQCRTEVVCGPALPAAPPHLQSSHAVRPSRPHATLERSIPARLQAACIHPHKARLVKRRITRRIVIRELPPAPPAPQTPPPVQHVVMIPPPCPPRATEATPTDYSSAVQNGYLTWASRSR